ncbi:MAG: hypothetical protein JWO51_95 [Rhodospirillales bacterium]|nr:hypothetical protein [Rhodospirillales bacterium]
MSDGPIGVAIGTTVSIVFLSVVCGGLYGCPQYNVYEQKMSGEAELAKAESTRRTKVLEAQAVVDSAQKLADAEVIRAGGVAQANKIIGDSLKGNESYLRYLWIDKLDASKGQVVYVPTEAGLPILEAGKRP